MTAGSDVTRCTVEGGEGGGGGGGRGRGRGRGRGKHCEEGDRYEEQLRYLWGRRLT